MRKKYKKLDTLSDISQREMSKTAQSMRSWGYFPTTPSSTEIHVLFQDTRQLWRSPKTLNEVLGDPQFTTIASVNVIGLTTLLVKSHFYFSSVREALGVEPRPKHFRFFRESNETGVDCDNVKTPSPGDHGYLSASELSVRATPPRSQMMRTSDPMPPL